MEQQNSMKRDLQFLKITKVVLPTDGQMDRKADRYLGRNQKSFELNRHAFNLTPNWVILASTISLFFFKYAFQVSFFFLNKFFFLSDREVLFS